MGIEPTQPAWKAGILPLNYARTEVKPKPNTYQRQYPHSTSVPAQTQTLRQEAVRWRLGEAGFEPAKANATRFTVWPLWPLGYSPLIILFALALSLTRVRT